MVGGGEGMREEGVPAGDQESEEGVARCEGSCGG